MKITAKNREGKLVQTEVITRQERKPQLSECGSKQLKLKTQGKQREMRKINAWKTVRINNNPGQ